MSSIGLLQVEKETASRLLKCDKLPDAAVREFSGPNQLLEALEADASDLDAVVLGRGTPEPISVAQRIQAVDKLMAVTIFGRPEDQDELCDAIRFSPFLNGAVRCETVSEDRSADQLAQVVLDAATGTRQRRMHRARAAASRELLTTQPPPEPRRTAYLEHFFDKAPLGMVVLDGDGLIQDYNHASSVVLDTGDASLRNTALSDHLPKGEGVLLEEFIQQSTRMRSTCVPAFFTVHEEPERILQITVSAFRASKNGSPGPGEGSVVVFLQDATALVQAEREARELAEEAAVTAVRQESEARYQELFDLAPVGYHQLDTEGTIIRVNRTELQLLGYEAEEMLGHSVWEFAEEAESFRQTVREELYGKRVPSRNIEPGFRCKDGSIISVLIENRLIHGEDGTVNGMLSTVQDITELKRTRRQLVDQARALRESNKELQQFAYVASHDLREPLRMVSGYVELLANRYEGKLDSEADEFIGYAVDGAKRMQSLISDLLLYSRVGTRTRTPKPVDLNEIFEEVTQNLEVAIEESGGEIICGPLPDVEADATQMIQLFQNLIDNALKFHGARSPVVRIAAEQDDGRWVFSVQDRGIGIDPEARKRIFKIFQRLHGVTEYPGTGIGLAICKKIVERHSGEIWVESEPGFGATFRFTLPVAE